MKYVFHFVLALFLLMTSLEALVEQDIPIVKCQLNRSDKRKADIAIATIFRNEGAYLKEWIEYHRLVGVSHFYLYNNLSIDNYWTVLQPYVEKGIVELFDVPFDSNAYFDGAATHNFVQVTCYNHAIKLARKANKWLAIIDSDEFICPVKDDTLQKALRRYKHADGIVVYWQIYGTSNVWDLQPGELLIEKLLYKEPHTGGKGLFKSIVKPRHAICKDPHLTLVEGGKVITPDYKTFSHKLSFPLLPIDTIRINHYTYRTLSYYFNQKKPRRAQWGFVPSPELEQSILDRANSVYDPIMLRFVDKLKAALKV